MPGFFTCGAVAINIARLRSLYPIRRGRAHAYILCMGVRVHIIMYMDIVKSNTNSALAEVFL